MLTYSEIVHPPIKGEIAFQDFCLKLMKSYWKDNYAQTYGKRGDGQQGVDISGDDNVNGLMPVGMQCKGSESNKPRQLSNSDIEGEVEKAKKFRPSLKLLIIAYTGDKKSSLMERARELSEDNEGKGLFRVVLWAWEDIVREAYNFPEIAQELLVANQVPLGGSLDPQRPKSGKAAELQRIQTALADLQSAIVEEESQAATDDPINNARIDVFKDQIAAGDGRATIAPLRAFIEGLEATASARVRFRAHANLGSALVQCGDFDGAAAAFREACATEPDTAECHAYAARAALFEDNRELAFAEADKALSIDPSQKLAATLYVDAASNTIPAAQREERVRATLAEFDVGWAVARAYGDEGNHEAALKVIRATEDKKANWARGIATGEIILRRFNEDLAIRVGAPLNGEDRALLEEARDLLKEGWEKAKQRGDKANWAYVGINLGAAYNLLGDQPSADQVALEAFELSPSTKAFQQRAALAYLHQNETPRAIELAKQVGDGGTADDLIFAASLQTLVRDWPAVAESAQKAFDQATDDADKARAAELVVVAELNNKGAREAFDKAEALRPAFASNIGFEGRAAEVARRLGDKTALSDSRKRFAQFEGRGLTPIERFELADAFADDNQWSKTADLLDGLHTLDRPSEILRRRLFALFRAERRADARALFESLKPGARGNKEILGLGAAIYDRSGLLPQALSALNEALALDAADLRSHLDWCSLSIRNGEEHRVGKWVKKTGLTLAGDPEDKLEFAQILSRYGRRRDALRLAYETIRRHWGKSERLHTMFMSLFLLAPDRNDTFLHPKIVAEDTVVFLEDDRGAKAHYRIETGAEPATDVLAPDHTFAKELIGAAVGDTRVAPGGLGDAHIWKVVAIKHKYLDLFHHVMETHTTVFPDSKALGTVHIEPGKEGGFEPIFERVRERAKLADEVTELYRENIIPIDAAAKALGVDPIDAALGIRLKKDVRLDTCVGTHDERKAAVEQITGAAAVLIEPITLAIWQEIGLLPVVEILKEIRIEVVQSTVDVLADRAFQAEQAIKTKGGSLEARGEQVALIEPTKDERKAVADLWSGLLKWIRAHVTVVATETSKEFAGTEVKQILSRASIDTLATAAATGTAFLCDDRRLRILGQSVGIVRTSWTQAFLVSLVQARKLDEITYTTICAKLARGKIGFVSVGSADLIASQSIGEDAFLGLVDALTHPMVDPRSLLSVFQEFTLHLWMEPAMVAKRDGLVGQILEGMLARPDGVQLFRIFAADTFNRMKEFAFPMNLLARLWSEYIDRFLRGHFLYDTIKKR